MKNIDTASFVLTADLKQQLQEIAALEQRSVSAQVRIFLAQAVEQHRSAAQRD